MLLNDVKPAVAAVKPALGSGDGKPYESHYLFEGGMVYATDGIIYAGCPVSFDGTMVVPAKEFDAILSRLPGEPDITIEATEVKLKSKRFRGSVHTLPRDVFPDCFPATKDGTTVALDQKFRELVEILYPLMTDKEVSGRAWLCSIMVCKGKMMAVQNGTLFTVADAPEFGELSFNLPRRACEFLLKRKVGPVRVHVHKNFVVFDFNDGSRLRSQLYEGGVPEVLFTRLEQANNAEGAWDITAEFREAVARVSGLSSTIVLQEGKVYGRSELGEFEEDSDHPYIGVNTRWPSSQLQAILPLSKSFSIRAGTEPPPAFRGDRVYGMIAPMRED